MSAQRLAASPRATARKLRLLAILDCAGQIGMAPLGLSTLHTIAYFSDVLAPVWHLPVMDGQILKRTHPYYPSLQEDLDRLVGSGVVRVHNVSYQQELQSWLLSADYELREEAARPILDLAGSYRQQAADLSFVREVVYATSGLGDDVVEAASVDATYADPLVALGGLIDVDPDGAVNQTVGVARRFGDLLSTRSALSTAEMVHLYVRQLYSRLQVV